MNEFITSFTKANKTTKPYDYRREAYTTNGGKSHKNVYFYILYDIYFSLYMAQKINNLKAS